MDVIEPSTLSAALQGLGSPTSTQHRVSYLAAWLWVCLSVPMSCQHSPNSLHGRCPGKWPQPSTWGLAVWCSIVPVLQSVLRCVLLPLASLTPSPLWSSFSMEHFPFVLVETVSLPSRFHSRSFSAQQTNPSQLSGIGAKVTWFPSLPKLKQTCPASPSVVHTNICDLPGSADTHDRIRGARLPTVLHSLLSS